MMDFLNAVFVKSSSDFRQCPAGEFPEYAFIGRSNVGKSSLINMLTRQKGLAKTSVTPGKTQLINHFLVNEQWLLADLPGYGYARTPKSVRAGFGPLIQKYLVNRANLLCTFLLIDCRHEPQAIDVQFMDWLAEQELSFVLVFTKADKLGPIALQLNLAAYKAKLQQEWDQLPLAIISSAKTGSGRDDILGVIESANEDFVTQPGK